MIDRIKGWILGGAIGLLSIQSFPINAQELEKELSDFASTERPWLWWYWLGSAVDHEGLDWHLQQFKDMGYGGASIAATYGVDEYKDRFVPFMSKEWIDLLNYTATSFKKNGMGIDASLTSAWPFGGPNVTPDMGAKYSIVSRAFTAMPYENVNISVGGLAKGKVQALSAYSNDGEYIDLSKYISSDGILSYTFPAKKYDVYALSYCPTGQYTKRSGLGGEGLVVDHFDKEAVKKYLERFDELFQSSSDLRSTFNDSYEVYGADYTPALLDEFKKRRGYDLREVLYLLDPSDRSDNARRVLCDYRETVADLLLDNFVKVWHEWANGHGVKTVEQAHGTPANWLDLYGASDIPQTESFGASPLNIKNVRIDKVYNEKSFGRPDKMLLKFASSASHVMGKALTSSETATWLGDHFKVALSQAKPQIDELYVSGINHIMLTCGAYSPREIGFPGWRFYPAANFGITSAFKKTIPNFSLYVARCQHLLQNSQTDNEVLLYVPMHDFWTESDDEDGRSKLKMFTIHNPDTWFYRQDIGDIARTMKREGFDFDYVSDRQLLASDVADKKIVTQGKHAYTTIVVPCCKRMPLATLRQLRQFAANGVQIVFAYRMPRGIPGYNVTDAQRKVFNSLLAEMREYDNVQTDSQFCNAIKLSGVVQESFGAHDLEFIRMQNKRGVVYFVANQSNEFDEGWIKLGKTSDQVMIYDPLTGKEGIAKQSDKGVYLQLKPGESCFIKLFADGDALEWDYHRPIATFRIDGDWKVSFKKGTPVIPASYNTDVVGSWTAAPDTMAQYFSGVGVYETTFNLPNVKCDSYQLALGDVRETAKVWINEQYIGESWSVPFNLSIKSSLLKKKNNKLRIEVRNLDANRMIWMDRSNIKWQTFFLVDVAYRNFSAKLWNSVPSGLLGPVELRLCGNE